MPALSVPRGLGRLFTDVTSTRRDDSRDAQFRELSRRVGPSAGPIRINGIKFTANGSGGVNSVDVAHLLGRKCDGYRVVRSTRPVSIAREDSPHEDRFLRLTCNPVAGASAGDELTTIDIEVW